jgi:hypothetical protein
MTGMTLQHTFGGSHLDRHVFDFDTDDGGDPGFVPAPPEPAGDVAPEPEAAPWAPAQEEWERLQGAVSYLAQLEQQRAQVYQPQQNAADIPRPDPWERPDTFHEDLDRYIEAKTAPFREFQNDAQLSEGEERALDILGDLAATDGEFDKEMARLRADRLHPEMVQRFGPGPKAAEAALQEAARQQREFELRFRKQAVDQYTNQLATLAGAPGEPGSTYTQGVQERVMPNYREGGSVTARFFGNNDR